MKNKILSLVFFLSLNLHSQQTLTWNLKSLYGISQEGFIAINKDIKDHFVQYPDDTIIIEIDEGTYFIGGNDSYGIHISNITQSGGSGRLIYQGAGKNRTNLVFTDIAQHMLRGVNVYRTEFRDMHMTRPNYTVTQGHVVCASKGKIILAIQEGFPSPLDIWKDWDQGRLLRKYTNSLSNPILIERGNKQVYFGYRNGQFMKPRLFDSEKNWWQFFLDKADLELTNYPKGTLVGVKSKHAGDAYWFNRGDDILFKNIKWTHSSRGLVRGGINNVRVIGCSIERAEPINGQVQCMSTSDGGIQMNQYESTGNPVSTGMIVKDFFCDSPGDDCVAFFNVDGGQVINAKLNNSFSRGIFLAEEAKNICVLDSEMNNCFFQDGEVDKGSRIVYKTHSLQEALDDGYLKDDCEYTCFGDCSDETTYGWDFEDGTLQGWINEGTSATVSQVTKEGKELLVITGGSRVNPTIKRSQLHIDTRFYSHCAVTLRVPNTTTGPSSVRISVDGIYSNKSSVTPINFDNFQTYFIPLEENNGWQGTIHEIRLQFKEADFSAYPGQGEEIEIDKIEFMNITTNAKEGVDNVSEIPENKIDKYLLVSSLVSSELVFFKQQKNIKVIDTFGVIVASGKNISTLDVTALAKGVYVVYSAKNMERFIKQ